MTEDVIWQWPLYLLLNGLVSILLLFLFHETDVSAADRILLKLKLRVCNIYNHKFSCSVTQLEYDSIN